MPHPSRSLLVLCILLSSTAFSQDSSRLEQALSFPSKLFSSLNKKTESIESKLDRKTNQYLTKLERREKKLYKKLYRKDSILAKQTFGNVDSAYAAIRNSKSPTSKYSNVYSGHLDTLTTAIKFLDQKDLAANPQLQKTLESYKALQQQLNISEQIKKRLQQRQKLLGDEFQKLGMIKQLKGFQKDVYYYSAQIKEYKKIFEDPSKLEQKLVDLVMKTGVFKDFFRKNSELGRMFALPGNGSTSVASLAGLQTRASVGQLFADRFGSSASTTQMLRDNVQAAQGQLNQLKDKIGSYASGSRGNGNTDAQDFKPNTQKTKSFLKRLEFGTNFQSQKSRYYFPVTTDIGFSLGYKLNDRSIIGVGASYKLGLGRGWEHLALTHQGIGLRSYVDYKIKGNVNISGGFEQNHLSQFKNIGQLKDYSSWQSSGLIGLSKKYKVSRKVKGEMKLLWDFLSYRQVPRTQAVLFRLGYNIK
jgi:hypothetical protein